MPSVRLIEVRHPSSKGIRQCRSCDKNIETGEFCLSYLRRGGRRGTGTKYRLYGLSSRAYHCLECGWRYNSMTVEEGLDKLVDDHASKLDWRFYLEELN